MGKRKITSSTYKCFVINFYQSLVQQIFVLLDVWCREAALVSTKLVLRDVTSLECRFLMLFVFSSLCFSSCLLNSINVPTSAFEVADDAFSDVITRDFAPKELYQKTDCWILCIKTKNLFG